jgi:ABC-type Na+ efflux pump permease subunit
VLLPSNFFLFRARVAKFEEEISFFNALSLYLFYILYFSVFFRSSRYFRGAIAEERTDGRRD